MYWFLSEPFQRGAVYDRLTKMQFSYIVGMDVGHGESLVCVQTRKKITMPDGTTEEKVKVRKQDLDKNGNKRVPSIIAFREDGSAVIGHEAKQYDFIQDFKVDPSQWGDPFFGGDRAPEGSAAASRTYGDLMEIFIRELWKGVLQQDPNLKDAAQKGMVLITVGCPSSSLWTNAEPVQAYINLIQKATGCSHVAVLAESTAAIMAVILDANEVDTEEPKDQKQEKIQVQLSKGLAVIDGGSSTIDFTYVLLGRKLVTDSINVAGYHIDEQMLEEAVKESGLAAEDIPAEQRMQLLVQLRGIKEDIYPDQNSQGSMSIDIWERDEQGTVNKDVKSKKSLQFVANQGFMDRVLDRPIRVSHVLEPLSWRKRCKKFISDCSILVDRDEKNELLCDKVILTGGTSYVPALYDAAVEKYSTDRIAASRDRSASVARGLCYAKGLECRGGELVEGYQKDAQDIAKKHYEAFISELSRNLAEKVCDHIRDITAPYVQSRESIIAGRLLDKIKLKIYADPGLTGSVCRDQVQALFVKHFGEAQNELQEKVNDVSRQIYGANLDQVPKLPQLTDKDLEQIMMRLNITVSINNIWQSILVNALNVSSFVMVLNAFGKVITFTPYRFLTPVLLKLSELLKKNDRQAVRQFVLPSRTRLPNWLIAKIFQNTYRADARKELIDQTVKEAEEVLTGKNVMKDIFFDGVSEQAEILLGKVLFLVYDEEPVVQ